MQTTPALLGAGAISAAGLAAVGIAWHDCLLVAAGTVAGQRLFIARMDHGAPWAEWRVALGCIEAGLIGLLSAVGLSAMALSALLGWWQPEHPYPAAALAFIAGTSFVLVALRSGQAGRWSELRLWAGVFAAVWLALWLAGHGVAIAPCLSVLAVAGLLARSSWLFACVTANGLLKAGRRMP